MGFMFSVKHPWCPKLQAPEIWPSTTTKCQRQNGLKLFTRNVSWALSISGSYYLLRKSQDMVSKLISGFVSKLLFTCRTLFKWMGTRNSIQQIGFTQEKRIIICVESTNTRQQWQESKLITTKTTPSIRKTMQLLIETAYCWIIQLLRW